jgi:deoxyribonuclease-4
MPTVKGPLKSPRAVPHPGPHRLGAHLPIAGGMHKALEQALRLRCDTVQVFVKNQRQWRAAPLQTEYLDRWFDLLATPNFGPVIAHATYLINLASPNPKVQVRSRSALAEELERCQTLHIPYLVLHPGSTTGGPVAAGVRRVAQAIDHIFEHRPGLAVKILLETTAGQGSSLGATFGQLGDIIAQILEPVRVGVCVDTCHVFAVGYDLRTPAGYERLIREAAAQVGLDRILCWHLNDSAADLGQHRDRHAHIGHGHLGLAAFRNLLADMRFRGVPMILETPKGTNQRGEDWDAVNLRRLRRLAARVR